MFGLLYKAILRLLLQKVLYTIDSVFKIQFIVYVKI